MAGDDGLIRPKIFWLGRNHIEAIRKAERLVKAWQLLRARGQEEWDPKDIERVEEDLRFERDEAVGITEEATESVLREIALLDRARRTMRPDLPPLLEDPHFAAGLGQHLTKVPDVSQNALPKTNASDQPKTLYDAIASFLESFKSKRKSETHKPLRIPTTSPSSQSAAGGLLPSTRTRGGR